MATDHQHPPSSHGDDGPGPLNHETTDINLEGVGKLAIGFIVVLLTISAAMYGTFLLLDRRSRADQAPLSKINADRPVFDNASAPLMDAPNALEQRGRRPAGPELLTNEPLWLRGIRARQLTATTTYGWANKDAGVVHMPIERAKQLILDGGLPATAEPAVAVDPAADPAAAAAADPAAAPAPPDRQ